MIIVMKRGATSAQIDNVIARIEHSGCRIHLSEGEQHTIVGVIGNVQGLNREQI